MKKLFLCASVALSLNAYSQCTVNPAIEKGMYLLKNYAPSGIIDNPNAGEFTYEDEAMLIEAIKLLRENGISEEELEIASGCLGYEEFKKYHLID